MTIHDEVEHALVEEAIRQVVLPGGQPTLEHRLTFMIWTNSQRLDSLPDRIASALNGRRRRRDKARAAILPTGGVVAALAWILKAFEVIG